MRPPNIFVQLPVPPCDPSELKIRSLKVAFLDFDWEGLEGEVRYPPLMSQEVPWPPGAELGALIYAAHDRELLASSFKGEAWTRTHHKHFLLVILDNLVNDLHQKGSGL
jgi:hypothetical protein